MKLLYGFIFLFLSLVAGSQKLIKGVVLEEEKNAPIPNASVFLNTTAIGTITTTHGDFSLTIPNGKFELVVSAIGYETYAQTINAIDASDFITVKMKIKVQELEAVTIQPYEKDGWQKWGQFFWKTLSAHLLLPEIVKLKTRMLLSLDTRQIKNSLRLLTNRWL